MSATPLLLNVFIFQRINGIFFFDLMHCIDHGCKDHKKYAECCNKLLLLYSFTWHNRGYRNRADAHVVGHILGCYRLAVKNVPLSVLFIELYCIIEGDGNNSPAEGFIFNIGISSYCSVKVILPCGSAYSSPMVPPR